MLSKLPDFFLYSTANKVENFSGMDQENFCADKKHFRDFPYQIQYKYNSRGFRDNEWPDDLDGAIWCFGDSFTAGIGSPLEHTWPQILQELSGIRTINISMDGASNQWIARKIHSLANSDVVPLAVIAHWSYIHRREADVISGISSIYKHTYNTQWLDFYDKIKDKSWPRVDLDKFDTLPQSIKDEIVNIHMGPSEQALLDNRYCLVNQTRDEDRRLHYKTMTSEEDDIANLIHCALSISKILETKVVHSFIPDFAATRSKNDIVKHLSSNNLLLIEPFDRLDVARDGHHYGLATAQYFVKEIIKII